MTHITKDIVPVIILIKALIRVIRMQVVTHNIALDILKDQLIMDTMLLIIQVIAMQVN